MRRSILAVAALLALPGAGRAQQATDVSAARAGIAAAWAAFQPLWAAGNAAQGVAVFFTDDAINMIPGAPSDSGHAAITKAFAAFFAAGNKVSGNAQTTDEVQVAGRTAIERGTFIQTITPTGGQPSVQRSRYLAVWSRQPDGKWKCTRFLFNDLPPQ